MRFLTTVIILAAGVFTLDLALPLGVAEGVLYVVVVLTSLRSPKPWLPVAIASACTVLTVLGYFLSPPGGVPWVVLMNRGLAILAIWVTALLLLRHKRIEVSLLQSQEWFRDITQAIPDVFWVHDAQSFRILFVSPAYEAVWGRMADSIYKNPKDWMEAIHPDDQEQVHQQFAQALERHEMFDEEYRIIRPDGQMRWIHDRGTPIFDDQGAPHRMVGIAEDITEKKNAAQERRNLEAIIQHSQKLETIGLLAGGIAHDFNNLLTGILGNASLAMSDLDPDSSLAEPVGRIQEAAASAATLANQLLAYAGKGQFHIKPVDLSAMVDEMRHILQSSVSKKAMLECALDRELPAIEVDIAQVQQVVLNLVTNASDALGEQSGVITVKTFKADYDRAGLRTCLLSDGMAEGRYVVLLVSDTGCGIAPETASKIFDPFFTTKFTGRGLGLAALMGIVRSHKGGVRVQSEVDCGTTIEVLFPASEREVDVEPADEVAVDGWRGSGTVLVVDDEETVRTLAKSVLSKCGFEVLTAADGRQGLEVFGKNAARITAVLLDRTMPHLSGSEVLSELHRARPDLPVVLSSGYTDSAADLTGNRSVRFINKPYEADQLIAAFREVLDGESELPPRG